LNLIDLSTFCRVAAAGSLTRAAADLGVPKSTVSRRVARLEDELGLALLTRTGRSVALTDVGRRLYKRTEPSLREIRDVERELVDAFDEPAGTLRVTAPNDIGGTPWFVHMLTSYRARFPEVVIEVELSNRMVDLVAEGVDVGLRAGSAGSSSTLVSRALLRIEGGLYASPSYLERRGVPREPTDLSHHACVTHSAISRNGRWTLLHEDGHQCEPVIGVVLSANDFNIVNQGIQDGAGIGFVPRFAAQPLLDSGELVRVLPQWRTPGGSLYLIWPASRHLAPRVRAFVDHAVEIAGQFDLR